MTPSVFDKKIAELVASIKLISRPFADTSPLAIAQRTDRALVDYEFFARTYFPHYITADFIQPHHQMLAASSLPHTITAVMGFRGLGKSVHLTIIRPLWLALRGDIHFYIAVSDNEELAKERTSAIAAEMQNNERLLGDFGELLSPAYSDYDFLSRSAVRFLALGWQQPIRGKVNGCFPPDYIVIDDFESHRAINPAIARRKLQYVREEAFGALHNSGGAIVWLGNLTHSDSALAYFKTLCDEQPDNPQIKYLLYKVRNLDGSSVWPQQYSEADLQAIENAMGSLGFQRHMMMNPILEGVKFKYDWFRYYSALPSAFDKIVTYCDPSLSAKPTADYKSIITLGLADKRYYLLDCHIRKVSLNAMLKYLYKTDRKFTTRIFMESNFWQQIIWQFIPNLAESEGYLLPVTGIENRLPKSQRIEALTPLFEWEWILFPQAQTPDTKLLEEQLLGYPDYPYDDGPDALAGAIAQLKNFSHKLEYRGVKSCGFSNRFTSL